MKVTKKTVTTVTETTTSTIHLNIKVIDIVVNGKPSPRQIVRNGKIIKDGIYNIDYWPIYNPDLKYLEETNPFWHKNKTEDAKWFEGTEIPENIEDIDPSKFIFGSSYDHSFYDVDLNPILVVIHANYIDGGIRNRNFDLEKLHKHLSKHKQVKKIGDIEPIPYYNNDGGEYFFEVNVIPTKKQLTECFKAKRRIKDDLFYVSWRPDMDLLGMKKFYIGKDD
jgi:hypothetical protein